MEPKIGSSLSSSVLIAGSASSVPNGVECVSTMIDGLREMKNDSINNLDNMLSLSASTARPPG